MKAKPLSWVSSEQRNNNNGLFSLTNFPFRSQPKKDLVAKTLEYLTSGSRRETPDTETQPEHSQQKKPEKARSRKTAAAKGSKGDFYGGKPGCKMSKRCATPRPTKTVPNKRSRLSETKPAKKPEPKPEKKPAAKPIVKPAVKRVKCPENPARKPLTRSAAKTESEGDVGVTPSNGVLRKVMEFFSPPEGMPETRTPPSRGLIKRQCAKNKMLKKVREGKPTSGLGSVYPCLADSAFSKASWSDQRCESASSNPYDSCRPVSCPQPRCRKPRNPICRKPTCGWRKDSISDRCKLCKASRMWPPRESSSARPKQYTYQQSREPRCRKPTCGWRKDTILERCRASKVWPPRESSCARPKQYTYQQSREPRCRPCQEIPRLRCDESLYARPRSIEVPFAPSKEPTSAPPRSSQCKEFVPYTEPSRPSPMPSECNTKRHFKKCEPGSRQEAGGPCKAGRRRDCLRAPAGSLMDKCLKSMCNPPTEIRCKPEKGQRSSSMRDVISTFLFGKNKGVIKCPEGQRKRRRSAKRYPSNSNTEVAGGERQPSSRCLQSKNNEQVVGIPLRRKREFIDLTQSRSTRQSNVARRKSADSLTTLEWCEDAQNVRTSQSAAGKRRAKSDDGPNDEAQSSNGNGQKSDPEKKSQAEETGEVGTKTKPAATGTSENNIPCCCRCCTTADTTAENKCVDSAERTAKHQLEDEFNGRLVRIRIPKSKTLRCEVRDKDREGRDGRSPKIMRLIKVRVPSNKRRRRQRKSLPGSFVHFNAFC